MKTIKSVKLRKKRKYYKYNPVLEQHLMRYSFLHGKTRVYAYADRQFKMYEIARKKMREEFERMRDEVYKRGIKPTLLSFFEANVSRTQSQS